MYCYHTASSACRWKKTPLSEFKQKPYATFGPQHLNYNMRKIFQQTPSAQGPVEILSLATLKLIPSLNSKTQSCYLCVRPSWPQGPEQTHPLIQPSYFTQRNSLRQQLLQIISHTELYIYLSFWQNRMLQHFIWHFLQISSEIWQIFLSFWAAKQIHWSRQH